MKKTIYTLCLTILALSLNAQNARIAGRITDEKGEGLLGANVIIDIAKGIATSTDFDGNYELSVAAGTYEVTFRYIGKEEQKITLTLKDGEKNTRNITLKDKQKLMDEVVISGSKFERKLKEETVSMDVMKGTALKDQNITSLDAGVQKIPGVTIADGQANIRGGAGWSYGAGSRVAILYDGLPITTADADDAKWSVIPMEQVEQVEVIKGASSALYGSGALNGIINAITAWPTDKPYTSVQTYFGFYGNPPTGSMRWWMPGQLQYFSGFSVADRRKIGQVDLSIAAGYTSDQGYLDSSQSYDMHLDVKLRWRVKKIEGLSMGFNVVAYYSWGKTFFLWDSVGAKGYEPLPGTITIYHDGRYLVDPFLTYFDKKDNKFTFKYRYLNSTNLNTTGQGSIGHRNYAELQYAKLLKKYDLNIITGAVGMYDIAASPPGDSVAASLIGNHNRGNFAVYAQIDKRFVPEKINTTLGVRWEYFNVDDTSQGSHNGRKNSLSELKYPLARIGLNWQAAEGTFIRVSGGLSFRYPSLAEMYVNTRLGPLGIYSDPNLQPEKGYSAEVGARQLIKIGKSWGLYGDVALYLNEYQNMMEFTFGPFGPPSAPNNGAGFSSQNIGTARILGTDIGVGLQGKTGDFGMSFLAGYTYIDARSLNWNDTLKEYHPDGTPLSFHLTYANTSSSAYSPSGVFSPSNSNNFLKYRSKNQLKLLLTLSYKFFEVNADYQYLGFQQNIDAAFVLPPLTNASSAFAGLVNYRDQQIANGSKGYNILNVGVGFKVTTKFKVAVIVKNAANTEWMTRPGQFQAPRNYTLQLAYTF
jgi:outer membrane receptor protein involved in Fe transport